MNECQAVPYEIRDLWYAYPGQEPALRGVTLTLEPGAYIGLIGQNGSGKTTLAKQLNGLLRPERGAVYMDGVDIRTFKVPSLASSVAYLYQNPDEQIFSPTVRDELAFGPKNLAVSPAEVERRVEALLDRFDLTPYADRAPATLSYGLRRKITAASVFAAQTPLLILDEPTSGLDAKETAQIMEYTLELNRRGCTLVLITHDMQLIAEYAGECVVLHQGRMLDRGTPGEIFSHASILRQVQLDSPQISRLVERLGSTEIPRDVVSVEACCRSLASCLEAGGGGA